MGERNPAIIHQGGAIQPCPAGARGIPAMPPRVAAAPRPARACTHKSVIGKQSLADVRLASESGQNRYVRFVPLATKVQRNKTASYSITFSAVTSLSRRAMSRQRTPEVTASLAVTLALHIVHVRPRIWDEAICVRHPHLRECLCVEDSLLR